MRWNKKPSAKSDKTQTVRNQKRGAVGYNKKSALLEEAITQMNSGKYARSSTVLKELLALDPGNMEARRLFATLHLRLGSLIPARQAFDSLIDEAFQRQDYWLAESLLREYLAAAQRCVPYLEKLGRIYEEKGDAIEAVTEYGKAIDILIEDPDPENSQQASQLHAKIRDLAPGSPVAMRLASFFDTQTGELLARQPDGDPEAASLQTPEVHIEASSEQVREEPLAEVMPWELPHPNEAPSLSSPSSPALPVASSDVSWKEPQPTQEQALPQDVQSSQQADKPVSGETKGTSADIHPEEGLALRSGASISSFSQETDPGSALVEAEIVELDTLLGTTPDPPTEVDPILPRGDEATAQEERSPSEETYPDSQSPSLATSEAEDTGSILLRGEEFRAEAADSQIAESPLPESLQTGDQELPAAQTPDSTVPSSVGPLFDEPSELRPHGGLSWNAVFSNTAQSEHQDSGNVDQLGERPPQIDEAVGETLAESPSPLPLPGASTEENRETSQSFTFRDATSAGTPIAPMPWDQVQDSAVPIPPTELDTPPEVSTSPTVDQGRETPPSDRALTGEESDNKTDMPQPTSPEPDSFTIVQNSEVTQPPDSASTPQGDRPTAAEDALQGAIHAESESRPQEENVSSSMQDLESPQPQQPPRALADGFVGIDDAQAPPSVEERPVVAQPEPQGALEGPTMLDEPSIVETPPTETVAQASLEELVAADQTTAQDEIQMKRAESSSSLEDEAPPTDREISAPVDQIETSAQVPRNTTEAVEELYSFRPSPRSPSPTIGTPEDIVEPKPEVSLTQPVAIEEATRGAAHGLQTSDSVVEPRVPTHEPVTHQDEWQKAGESIRFIETPHVAPSPQPSPVSAESIETSRPVSSAASAVEVLFGSSPELKKPETKPRVASSSSDHRVGSFVHSAGGAIASFLATCFSTTRSIVATFVGLMVLSAVGVALCVGGIALVWVIMEEPPSPAFHSLTTIPQRTVSDSKKNGYVWLLGIDAPAEQDPIQVSGGLNSDASGASAALTCFGSLVPGGGEGSSASSDVMRKWFRGSDPVGQFKSHQGAIKGWGGEHQLKLERYGQWKKMPFEDWGYGQATSPPCATIAFAHQLHVADGFLQSMDQGVDRLETDMEAWRIALSQARTLPIKLLALQAINDDIAVASGLLVRSDFDSTHLGRVTKMLRPLDQGELSIRWPMQSELVTASKTYADRLKIAQAEAHTVSTTVATMLPLPKQRRLNDYAEYYEASHKAAGEGQYSSLPKWKSYIQFPAAGFMDYLTNPIENVVGLEPLPRWDDYNGLVVDTDARLRLASLQAWLRGGPADGDLLVRLAKAGQGFYDPYTGLPMLVNMKRGILYSVGHDGKDQDGDSELDVVVNIPVGHAGAAPAKSTAGSSRAK